MEQVIQKNFDSNVEKTAHDTTAAGKTTLLRHLIQNKANLKLAVLVNEIAEIDIDGQLLNAAQNNAGLGICTRELVSGCVCCSASDDLRTAVRAILERQDIVVSRYSSIP